MRIPCLKIIELLKTKISVQSLSEFVAESPDELRSSLTVATILEDYRYLAVMNNEGDKYKHVHIGRLIREGRNCAVFINSEPMGLEGLARLYFDVRGHFTIGEFYGLIEDHYKTQELNPDSLVLQFDLYFDSILVGKKMNNSEDVCPCNGGKKYKECHGSLPIAVPKNKED